MLKVDKPINRIRNRSLKDYAGVRFGRLTAVRLIEREELYNDHRWLFVCDCGAEKVARIKSVRGGHTQSCGCLAKAVIAARNKTHGLSRTSPGAYRSWKDMRSRCNQPSNTDFHLYGGRGIRVCERWSSFANFYADMGDRPEGMSIDRIDVNGHYAPDNCRWATSTEQANNKRNNVVIEIDGVKDTLANWCKVYGVRRETARARMKSGQPLDRVFSSEDFRQ